MEGGGISKGAPNLHVLFRRLIVADWLRSDFAVSGREQAPEFEELTLGRCHQLFFSLGTDVLLAGSRCSCSLSPSPESEPAYTVPGHQMTTLL